MQEIASECNSTPSSVSRYLNGSITPPPDIEVKILNYLGYVEDSCADEEGNEKETEAERENEADQAVIGSEETDMQTALAMLREVYEARIADIFKSVADLKAQVTHEKREKWIFFILLALVVVFVFALFYVDLSNGTVGWFRH